MWSNFISCTSKERDQIIDVLEKLIVEKNKRTENKKFIQFLKKLKRNIKSYDYYLQDDLK